MAQQPPTIEFEDVPLDETRRLSRGSRMDPELYAALKQKIQSLGNTAARLVLPEGTTPTTMKNRILRIAAELNVPMTIRKTSGGLIFWRSSAEDMQQVHEIASRLQPAQRRPQTRPRGRRTKGTR
jgi:hypothetical protein